MEFLQEVLIIVAGVVAAIFVVLFEELYKKNILAYHTGGFSAEYGNVRSPR